MSKKNNLLHSRGTLALVYRRSSVTSMLAKICSPPKGWRNPSEALEKRGRTSLAHCLNFNNKKDIYSQHEKSSSSIYNCPRLPSPLNRSHPQDDPQGWLMHFQGEIPQIASEEEGLSSQWAMHAALMVYVGCNTCQA